MARDRSIKLALVGAWFCVLITSAPAMAAAPTNTVEPEISRASGSRTMTTDTGSWSPVFPPDPNRYSYRWLRCTTTSETSCAAVGTGASYVLRTADIGRYFRSEVTARNDDGSTIEQSDPLGPIAAAPPVTTEAPRVTGIARNELALGATTGTWRGRVAGDPAFTIQWQRCTTKSAATCSSVTGARSTTYMLGPSDVGRFMRVVVGAEGLGRAQFAAPNPPVGPVQDLPPEPVELARLRPFPRLVVTGRLRGRTTRITGFVVRGPRRAKVSVRCKGRRCPFRRLRATIGKSKRLRLRRAQRSFRAGQTLEIRVTGRNRIGKFTRISFRRGRAPRRSDLCLRPAAKTPSPCDEV